MALKDLLPQPEPENKILVFIDGPFPSEKDQALAKKFGTTRFRNKNEEGYRELCFGATAVKREWVPECFNFLEEPPKPEEVKKLNTVNPTSNHKPAAPIVPLTPDDEQVGA
jgi:hypothetical protein